VLHPRSAAPTAQAESELNEVPRVIPKTNERDFEAYKLDQDWRRAREKLALKKDKLPSQITDDEVADYLAKREEAQRIRAEVDEERRQAEKPVYGPGSSNSFFRDFVADWMARKHQERLDFDPRTAGFKVPDDLGEAPLANAGMLTDVRKRLASVRPGVEQRDVSSADPGYASFLGPGFLGDRFNTAARAEASLAAALGLEPLRAGVKEVNIPRFATGSSAAVQNPEGSATSETDPDGDTQPGKIAAVAGHVDISLQALEWADPQADISIAADLGKAIGAAIDAQLVAGSNASGQTLGLASVTGIKTVSWVDASPTSAEFVGQTWEGYDQIANGGQGVADPDSYLVVMHPRRLAWAYNNVQNAQVIAPAVPGRIVASAGIRTSLGAGTEDECLVIVPAELPAFAGPPTLEVDDESLSGTLQVRISVFRTLATGFGRAPAAICRISGTGPHRSSLQLGGAWQPRPIPPPCSTNGMPSCRSSRPSEPRASRKPSLSWMVRETTPASVSVLDSLRRFGRPSG
jgi:HK97 family phage major capsid protein